MGDTAMHNEALRKTRMLERKREAAQRISEQYSQDDAMMGEMEAMHTQRAAAQQKQDFSQYKALNAEQSRVSANHGVAYDRMAYDHSRNGPTIPITWKHMERQLKYEEKVLRNHNLYMGPITAFKELYHNGMLEPKK